MPIYISEINVFSANGGDFVEVAAPAGTDMSGFEIYLYNAAGNLKSGPWTLGSPTTTQFGQDIYVVEQNVDGISISASDGVALIDDNGDVVQFLTQQGRTTVANDGPAAGATSTSAGPYSPSGSNETTDDGQTYSNTPGDTRGSIPCFGPGTGILTPVGVRPVETLVPGDAVTTVSGAVRRIVWSDASPTAVEDGRFTVPVEIKAGALGPGRPARDLVVSPQHRILLGDPCGTGADGPVLVPAKALLQQPGIRAMEGKRRIVWHHFAFDQHDLVSANGLAVESLLVGPMVVAGMAEAQRSTLRAAFPKGQAGTSWNGPACYPCLSKRAAHAWIAARALRTRAALQLAA